MLMFPLSPRLRLVFKDTFACQDTVKRQNDTFLPLGMRTHSGGDALQLAEFTVNLPAEASSYKDK